MQTDTFRYSRVDGFKKGHHSSENRSLYRLESFGRTGYSHSHNLNDIIDLKRIQKGQLQQATSKNNVQKLAPKDQHLSKAGNIGILRFSLFSIQHSELDI